VRCLGVMRYFRVLPHSSTPAIPSEARLRMRVLPLPPLVHLGLGPQRGSASRGRRPPGHPLRRQAQPQFRERILSRRNVATAFFSSSEENTAPLAKTLRGSPGPPRSPGKACVGVLARDLLADREAVVWRGETLLLDPRRKWEVV